MVARKGQPNLVNDPGYRPDWRERAKSHALDERMKMFSFRATGKFIVLLSKAARRRGMSNSAYVRRAVCAFISADMQMPFEDVCALVPAVERAGLTKDGLVWPQDSGEGYGKWDVKG